MSADVFAPLRELLEHVQDAEHYPPPFRHTHAPALARLLREHAERGEAIRSHLESIDASRGHWQPIGIVVDNLATTEARLRALISRKTTDA